MNEIGIFVLGFVVTLAIVCVADAITNTGFAVK